MADNEKLKVKFVYDGEVDLSDIFADMIAAKIKSKSQSITVESGGDKGYTDESISSIASRLSNGEEDDTNTNK